MPRFLMYVLAAVVLSAAPAVADDALTWQTNLADNKNLEIKGEIDAQKTSLSTVVELTASQKLTEIRVRRYALKAVAPAPQPASPGSGSPTPPSPTAPSTTPAALPPDIQPGDVKVICPTTLVANEPTEVTVTVTGLTRPGEYRGKVEIYPSAASGEHAFPINVHLVVHQRPDVRTVDAARSFPLVADRGGCDLFRWMLPAALKDTTGGKVRLDNQTQEAVTIDHVEVLMQNLKSGKTLQVPQDVEATFDSSLPPLKQSEVGLTFTRSQLSAGRYEGTMRVWLQGVAPPLSVSLTADVRNGSLWAVIAIAAGIGVGRLLAWVSSTAVQARVALLQRIYRARAAISTLEPLPMAKSQLLQLLDESQLLLHLRTASEAQIATTLAQVETAVTLLARLHSLRDRLGDVPDTTVRGNLSTALTNEEEGILKCTDQRVTDLRDDISRAVARKPATFAFTSPPTPGTARRSLATGVGWFAWIVAGVSRQDAEINYFVVRPLAFVLLLVLLLLAGVYTLYVNGSATFGANGIYDYLPLFLWGITADVAQKSLQNVQQLIRV